MGDMCVCVCVCVNVNLNVCVGTVKFQIKLPLKKKKNILFIRDPLFLVFFIGFFLLPLLTDRVALALFLARLFARRQQSRSHGMRSALSFDIHPCCFYRYIAPSCNIQ